MTIKALNYDKRVAKLSILIQRKRLEEGMSLDDLVITVNTSVEQIDEILASNVSYEEIPEEVIDSISEFLSLAPVALHFKTGNLKLKDFKVSGLRESSKIHDVMDDCLHRMEKYLIDEDEKKEDENE